MKNQKKGITLISLIITIILLLILAGISISALTGSGLFEKAKLAKNATQEAQELENQMLLEYENQINQLGSTDIQGKWIEKNDVITNGEITLHVGDYIDYTPSESSYTSECGDNFEELSFVKVPDVIQRGSGYSKTQTFNTQNYTGGWRLLGIDEKSGGLKIISSDIIKTIENSDFYLSGYTGYAWGPTELNDICKIFDGGKNCLEARSIEMSDINRITGYNPLKTGNGKIFQEGNYTEYGSEVTYYWYYGSDNRHYVKSLNSNGLSHNAASVSSEAINFNLLTGRGGRYFEPSSGEICKIKSTGYRYYATTLTDNKNDEVKGITVDDVRFNTLYHNEKNERIRFWIGNQSVYAGSNTVSYDIGIANYGDDGYNSFIVMYTSEGKIISMPFGVRPIVILDEKLEIKRWRW